MDDNGFNKAMQMKVVAAFKKPSMSVFNFFSRTGLKVMPILGLDFSQANLTFDDDICLHRTKVDKPKVYLKIIQKFIEAIKPISNDFTLPYVFGCKPMPGTQTSD